ncbi:hypothetical protein FRX31_004767, partial [Thalictrum thalictroides]
MAPLISTDSAALQVKSNSSHRPSYNKRQRPYCDHCNKYGHTRQTCYLIHGFPPSKSKGTTPSSTVADVTSNDTHEQLFPSLLADQYSRLLTMLSDSKADNDVSAKVNLTGNISNNLLVSV